MSTRAVRIERSKAIHNQDLVNKNIICSSVPEKGRDTESGRKRSDKDE